MYIISACLLGQNCKWNGGNNRCDQVVEFCEKHKHIVVCPERAGELTVPRPPAEKQGDRVIDKEGKDVTEAFIKGAEISYNSCVQMAQMLGETLEGAILKGNSPSCGIGQIYDGTFSKTLVEGNGIFADMLAKDGIEVITEKEKIKW